MVDFLVDGLRICKGNRLIPTLLTFVPPLFIAIIHPSVFNSALGMAGGFGEAFLNGLLPVLLVWAGRYKMQLESQPLLRGGKLTLLLLGGCALGVFGLEAVALIF